MQWTHSTENVIESIKAYLKRRRPDAAPQARSRRNPAENCRRPRLSADGKKNDLWGDLGGIKKLLPREDSIQRFFLEKIGHTADCCKRVLCFHLDFLFLDFWASFLVTAVPAKHVVVLRWLKSLPKSRGKGNPNGNTKGHVYSNRLQKLQYSHCDQGPIPCIYAQAQKVTATRFCVFTVFRGNRFQDFAEIDKSQKDNLVGKLHMHCSELWLIHFFFYGQKT